MFEDVYMHVRSPSWGRAKTELLLQPLHARLRVIRALLLQVGASHRVLQARSYSLQVQP